MKNILTCICLIFNTLISTCQESFNQLDYNGKKNGKWIGFYEVSNNKRYEGFFENDKPVGQFIYYSDKGHVSAKVDFINDSISSSNLYYDNGVVMAKGKFINKLKIGKWSTYLRTGDLLNIFNYKSGILDGSQFMYYPENKETKKVALMEEYQCIMNVKVGIWRQYYELGTLKAKGQYVNGKKQGVFEYYFTNGKIDKKGSFIDDQKNGLWYFYDIDNEKMDEIIYKMGKAEKIKLNKNEGQ